MRKLFYIGGALIVILLAGYYISRALIKKKIDEALGALPSSVKVTYGSLDPDIPGRSLVMNDVQVSSSGRNLSISRLTLRGIDYFALARSRKHVSIGHLECRGVKAGAPRHFSMEGDLEMDSIQIADIERPADSLRFGAIRLDMKEMFYVIPHTYETVQIRNFRLDSKRSLLQADTVRIVPSIGKVELGGVKGHQVDWVSVTGEGVSVKGLHVMDLLQHRLIADEISIGRNNIYVFRDRRLPLEESAKPLPVDYLKDLPLSIRVGVVKFGPGAFTYEEFPRQGDKTGVLKILRLGGTVKPLINRPVSGDPPYITVVAEGSLMGSGSVKATTRMPLHKGEPYMVEGAFHALDVTTLNPSAENLGKIHLESGMLNSLAFQFQLTEEKATGKIVGEYHDLVVDKLRGKDEKKVDKIKSFFLKQLIIPRNKDHTMPASKRTGTVDYKRDPARYFSYYLLHALLVGVKSSFSLGFLLPG